VFQNLFERYGDMQSRRHDEETTEQGFTLIELLIVIVVLGILAAIVIFSLSGVTGNSAVAACNSDAKTVETAVAAYNAQSSTALPALDNTGTEQDGTTKPLTTGSDPELHSWPVGSTNSPYQISYDPANGGVLVTIGNSTKSYDGGGACTGA
jgi:prepilin-type N-terminal cleavage/methylation domain-containing protein